MTDTEIIYRDVDYFTQEKKGEDKVFKIKFPFDENADTITRLQQVWRAMNVVEGYELPVRLRIRSMMVHDQVKMDGKTYQVAPIGWINADTGEQID